MGGVPNPPIDFSIDLKRLSNFLSSIGSFSEDMILFFLATETLHHYTNLDGMLAILSGGDIRLTHARYCNEEAEMTHGLELAKSVIAEERGKATDPKRQQYLDELTRLLTEVEVEPVYIACFCEAVDRL